MPFAQRTTHESEIPAIHEQLLSFVVNPLNTAQDFPLFIAPVDMAIMDVGVFIVASAPSTATTAKVGCKVPGVAYATSQDLVSLGALNSAVPDGVIAWATSTDASYGDGTGLTNTNTQPQVRNCVRKGELVFIRFSATASGACFNVTMRVNTIKEFGGPHRSQRSIAIDDSEAHVRGEPVWNTGGSAIVSFAPTNAVPPICDQDICVPIDTCNLDGSGETVPGIPILKAPYDLNIEEIFIYSETTPPGTVDLTLYTAVYSQGVRGFAAFTTAFTISNTATAAACRTSGNFTPKMAAHTLATGGEPNVSVLRAGETLSLRYTAGAFTAFGAVCVVIRVSSTVRDSSGGSRRQNSDYKMAQPALIMTGGLSTARTPLLICDRAYVIERMYVSGNTSQTSTAMQLALGPDAGVAGSNNPISADIDVTSASRAEAYFERTAAVGLNPGGDFLPTVETGIPNLNVVEAGNVLWFRDDDGAHAIQAGHRLSVGLLMSTVTRDLIPRAAV